MCCVHVRVCVCVCVCRLCVCSVALAGPPHPRIHRYCWGYTIGAIVDALGAMDHPRFDGIPHNRICKDFDIDIAVHPESASL